MKPTLSRPSLIGLAARIIPLESVNDLPLIWQTVNDLADGYRKSGYTVRDWDQDAITAAIQRRILDTKGGA